MVIFGLSAEVMSILTTFSELLNFNGSFLGVALLGIGKGIGDAINNVCVAKQGYNRMAFAACFGGAIFSKKFFIKV